MKSLRQTINEALVTEKGTEYKLDKSSMKEILGEFDAGDTVGYYVNDISNIDSRNPTIVIELTHGPNSVEFEIPYEQGSGFPVGEWTDTATVTKKGLMFNESKKDVEAGDTIVATKNGEEYKVQTVSAKGMEYFDEKADKRKSLTWKDFEKGFALAPTEI